MPLIALAVALAFLTSCGLTVAPGPVRKEEPPPKPIPLTGRSAFFKIYPSARQWAADAKGIQLSSMQVTEAPADPGKAAVWQATFDSEQRAKMKSFTWSAVDIEPNLHQGVFSGQEEAFTGRVGQAMPFFTQALQTDSDAAYKTALSHDDPFLKTNPKVSINFLVEQTPRTNSVLAWRVIWGETAGSAKYAAFVDATDGKFIAKVR